VAYNNTSPSLIKNYYNLTKPGIIYGNAVTTIAGFLLASKGLFSLTLFIATLFGIAFVIGSACVFNNYIDRSIDEKMERTKKRVSVTKAISLKSGMIYATFIGIIGFSVLFLFTNFLTTFLAFIGFFFYVVMYSIWKRKSVYGTIVGSVSGAIPIVVGYCAVSNSFDAGAIILFMIMVLWQMPHFYAIAIFRLKDYSGAGIPVLPIKSGIYITKIHMIFYIIAFSLFLPLLTFFGFTGKVYLVVAILLSLYWLYFAINGLWAKDDVRWARKMFGISLITITSFSAIISIGSFFNI
jgi:protoheme IX farnesyltransferase